MLLENCQPLNAMTLARLVKYFRAIFGRVSNLLKNDFAFLTMNIQLPIYMTDMLMRKPRRPVLKFCLHRWIQSRN